jgi:hypothetical protein
LALVLPQQCWLAPRRHLAHTLRTQLENSSDF